MYTNFFVEKMRVAFAVQKRLTFFQQKLLAYTCIRYLKFNETLTIDVVNFEQQGPDPLFLLLFCKRNPTPPWDQLFKTNSVVS